MFDGRYAVATTKWGRDREAGNQRHACRTLMTTTVQLIRGYVRMYPGSRLVVPGPDARLGSGVPYLQISV